MQSDKRNVPWRTFLKDIFICSLGAYGGPEAHYGIFADQLVAKKKYITEDELLELIALTGILPGPSSTQTLIAVGHKIGGPFLGFLTMLVWALPALIVMTLLSFLSQVFDTLSISAEVLRFIGPMAVGFILVAAWRLGRKVVTDKITLTLLLFGAVTTYFVHTPWIYPLVLFAGGMASVVLSGEKGIWNHVKISPPWRYLAAFAFFAGGSLILAMMVDNKLVVIFESFYRYGYLVIGGGQVVVPLMYTDLVEVHRYMTGSEFLTGFGLVQGLPGPMFSFSAYAGGLAARGDGTLFQILGAAAGGIAIFLPGILLIYFIYPIWEVLRKIKGIKIALKGVTAVAGGLIAAAGIVLMEENGFDPWSIVIMLATVVLLLTRKIPAPVIVLLVLAAGFGLH
jgi:chromate transporter